MSGADDDALTFLGAAGTVTGSRFLVETRSARFALDWGLFQGGREIEDRNWQRPAFDPRDLDAVVLSHAHLDHSGGVPRLVAGGFRGTVHVTRPTRELLRILWMDAARLEEQDAMYANKKGYSRHRPALPLFDTADVERALERISVHRYGDDFRIAGGTRVKFHRAGHILGSAFVECELPNGLRILHSGDLGRPDQPILRDPEPPPAADIVLVESTYGDRVHPSDGVERLAAAIRAGHARGGAILVPAFAVGRTQSLLWTLDELQRDGRIPRLSVFLDSPMAHRVGEATCRHGEDHDAEMRLATQEDRCPLCAGSYVRVSTPDESIALNSREGPFLVIAGSGMLSGGRILHHLAQRLGDERTTVLLTGFQAEGTRGRALVEGAPALRLFGKEVPVRARVEVIEGLSAHADREELLRWLALSPAPPRAVYAVHGEPGSAAALADTVRTRLGWPCVVPEQGMRVPLSLLAPTPRTSGPSG